MIRPVFIIVMVLLGMLLAGNAYAKDAADFELEDLKGDKVSLEELLEESDLLVVEFWETYCKPCNELVGYLQEYYDEYQEDGVEFVIICRAKALTLAAVEPFFTSHEYTFRVLLDTDQEVSADYGVKSSPATFIINPDGEIIYQHYGFKSGQEKEIEEAIEKYLAGEEVNDEEVEQEEETETEE